MRKFLVCVLSVLLIFCMTGCGNINLSEEDVSTIIGLFTEDNDDDKENGRSDKDDKEDSKNDKDKDEKEDNEGNTGFDMNNISQEDVQSWVSGLLNSMEDDQTGDLSEGLFGGMDFDELPSELQEQVRDEMEKEGVDIKTNSDGSTTYVSEDGSEVTQNEDGTWVITNEDGSTGQLGGDWPENEYTKQVPKPPFGLTAAGTDEYGFSVAFIGVETDDLRDYVEKLKDKGFTKDVESEDTEMFGIVMFTYAASNSKGYRVEVTSAMGVCGMTITKE